MNCFKWMIFEIQIAISCYAIAAAEWYSIRKRSVHTNIQHNSNNYNSNKHYSVCMSKMVCLYDIIMVLWHSIWTYNCMEKSNQYNSPFAFQKESMSCGLEQHLHKELGLFVFGYTFQFIPAYVQLRPGRAARVNRAPLTSRGALAMQPLVVFSILVNITTSHNGDVSQNPMVFHKDLFWDLYFFIFLSLTYL